MGKNRQRTLGVLTVCKENIIDYKGFCMTDKRYQKKLEKIKKNGERYKQEKELRDAYAEFMPEKKERKVSNVMLVVIVIAIVGYAIANFYLQYNIGIEISSTLTTCWYSFWGVEIAALGAIKVTKVKNDNSNIDFSETTDDSSSEDDSCG